MRDSLNVTTFWQTVVHSFFEKHFKIEQAEEIGNRIFINLAHGKGNNRKSIEILNVQITGIQ